MIFNFEFSLVATELRLDLNPLVGHSDLSPLEIDKASAQKKPALRHLGEVEPVSLHPVIICQDLLTDPFSIRPLLEIDRQAHSRSPTLRRLGELEPVSLDPVDNLSRFVD